MTAALVAYATKNGSTREVAEAIAEVLRNRGMTTTVAEAGQLREPLDSYDLIVLGGAIYSGRWHSDAQRFLRRHKRELDTLRSPCSAWGHETTILSPGRARGRNWIEP